MSVTSKSTFFYKDIGLFGSWPTQEQANQLADWGLDYFICLANEKEYGITPYITNIPVINFNIPDRQIPYDKQGFTSLIVHISKLLENGKKIYIHCKGGNGRSGMTVAATLMYINKISPEEALEQTIQSHAKREIISAKRVNNPLSNKQKQYIHYISKYFLE